MKKIKLLLVIMLTVLLLPCGVFAEENENTDDKKVNVYVFRGEGCPHCEEAIEWLGGLDDEMKGKFNLVTYEVWNNSDNSDLMSEVAKARNEEADGVPYIIVGNKSWNGFAEDYEDEIKDEINKDFDMDADDDDKYDIKDFVDLSKGKASDPTSNSTGNNSNDVATDTKKSKSSVGGDVVALLSILIVTGGIVYGIVVARKKTN